MNKSIIRRDRDRVKTLYSTKPLPPLDPRAPYDAEAMLDLVDHGAQLVLLHHYPNKAPLKDSKTPTYSQVFNHVVHMDGLIAIRPPSVGMTVLDIDRGEDQHVEKLASAWRPSAILRSGRRTPRAGLHFWYFDDVPRHDLPAWDFWSAGGQVKAASGYVAIYPGEEDHLLRALDRPRTRSIEELLDALQLPLWPVDQLPPVAQPAGQLPPLVDGFKYAPSVRHAQGQHQRHIVLMRLTLSALGRARDMRGDYTNTLSLMQRYNEAFPEPLADGEVERLCPYFVSYSRSWEGQPHTQRFLDRQRRKGLKSGVARQAAVWERNMAIRVARAEGLSVKDVAAMYGLTTRQVYTIVASPPL